MPARTEDSTSPDPGLAALVMVLRFHEIPVDVEQINHRFGSGIAVGVTQILRCAKDIGLKARAITTDWTRLARMSLPCIAVLREGGFLVLAKVAEDKILVQNPLSPRPQILTREELESKWNGGVVLIARRAKLADLGRRFDLSWFMGAIHKYRWLLTAGLLASFFLQVFALISPLSFHVGIRNG